jgi:energy-coupling factor transporter ATP-binding protein EcfA2
VTRDIPSAAAESADPTKSLQRQIKDVHDELRKLVADGGNGRLRELWADWDARLRDIFDKAKERPEVTISLVGGTGAGKSTLLNALIGARVLPVSTMRACTAAICEVSYSEGPYQARVDFVPREAWEHEVDLLLADLKDASGHAAEIDGSGETVRMTKAVRDKLWTVYRSEESSDQSEFRVAHLQEPEEITAALDAGHVMVASEDLGEFRKQIARYLDSKHRFWPIVKSVAVSGPFESLRDGARIVDLPGINDPNEAREQVTKHHIKTCRFVWIVFNIKRALTKDTLRVCPISRFKLHSDSGTPAPHPRGAACATSTGSSPA